MSRTARLFQLMQCLRSAAPPHTAQGLAQDLDVSPRTVHRDIDTLRGLGAVIDGAAGFGFTLIEDATLPPLGFENEELEALVLGLREVEQIGDPDLAGAARSALNKLQARLPARQSHRLAHAVLTARRFSRPEVPTIAVAELRQATWDETAIEFAYSDAQGAQTRRRVDPLGISYLDRSTVLVAWCHLRQDFRVFRLDRMSDLVVTDQSFRPRRVPMLRAALAQFQTQNKTPAAAETRKEKD
ncbi:helix-turn-helix transcriptional regulator [Sedimentitalea todarodis]|uniref:YafY family protein n=1 Tax=Sedimentitalea todarodis TaxID=1631240 RepID=A0ABU3VDI9_9RHOB|nr:YafY family protein [Sedimentitalea todarodis]MDU9004235.1 YafY family protein [Sedimentitalea todarodis]